MTCLSSPLSAPIFLTLRHTVPSFIDDDSPSLSNTGLYNIPHVQFPHLFTTCFDQTEKVNVKPQDAPVLFSSNSNATSSFKFKDQVPWASVSFHSHLPITILGRSHASPQNRARLSIPFPLPPSPFLSSSLALSRFTYTTLHTFLSILPSHTFPFPLPLPPLAIAIASHK
jgi:hypothetical protein